jgi:hypothetical protein
MKHCDRCGKPLPHDPTNPYPWSRCLRCEVATKPARDLAAIRVGDAGEEVPAGGAEGEEVADG